VRVQQNGHPLKVLIEDGWSVMSDRLNRMVSDLEQVEIVGQDPQLLKSGKHDHALSHQLWQTIRLCPDQESATSGKAGGFPG